MKENFGNDSIHFIIKSEVSPDAHNNSSDSMRLVYHAVILLYSLMFSHQLISIYWQFTYGTDKEL